MKFSPGSAATGFLLIAGLAPFSLSAPAVAQPTRAFEAEQVDCEADQLRAILGRSAILFGPFYDERSAMFLFTYGSPTGNLAGVALMEQNDIDGTLVGPERQLAFSVEPSYAKLLRNPSRPQLSTLHLVLDRLSSDASAVEQPHAMAIVVDPTLEPLKNEDPFSLLIINNLPADDGGVGADAKPGRGLQAIFERCSNTFSPADLHAFSVLTRTLRATAWEDDTRTGRLHKLVGLFRGAAAEPISGGVRTTYRADVYPVRPREELGRVSLEIQIDMTDDGSLGEGRLRVLPACAAAGERHCSSARTPLDLSVIRPVFANQTWSQPAPTVCWKGPAGCASEVTFSFAERLQDTTWERP